MSHKAQNTGTKVSAGRNDPIIQEGPGAVNSDSLAAESQAFREANAAGLERQQHRSQEDASASAPSPSPRGGAMPRETGSGGGSVDTAPSYVENQFRRDPSGPHGKNIKEDDSIGTGGEARNASFEAEIGSKDDPSLLAERKFYQANSVAPGSTGGREGAVAEKTPYDVLGDQEA
ncbi:hypothetical protein F5Y14DRAFT_451197 [Nemania sp. NC0429]|nr:hypothetical protein F5Y14DRAFT_451197 [Nemania sp. NC0429]